MFSWKTVQLLILTTCNIWVCSLTVNRMICVDPQSELLGTMSHDFLRISSQLYQTITHAQCLSSSEKIETPWIKTRQCWNKTAVFQKGLTQLKIWRKKTLNYMVSFLSQQNKAFQRGHSNEPLTNKWSCIL